MLYYSLAYITFFIYYSRVWYETDFSIKYGGKWAVITGASDGIGKSYALKLAKRKMNVFLISRNMEKLQKVAEEIELLFKVKTKCYSMDLANLSKDEDYQLLKIELESLDVGILVNNVGKMYDKLQYFLTVPCKMQSQIIDLNINAMLLMTYIVLPQMVARRNGAIINMASGASVQPTPLMTTYSASKAFVDVFTKALEYEYSSEGITMQAIQPFYVSTNMTHKAKPNILLVDTDSFVESAIRTLGVTRRTYGCWSHGIFGVIGEILPERVYLFGAIYLNPLLWSWLTQVKLSNRKTN